MKKLFSLFGLLPVLFLHAQESTQGNVSRHTYSILDFGASQDNSRASTRAINQAIETCSKNGGGTVIVPSGKFTSGTIILKGNVDLHLEAGATLYASNDRNEFPDFSLPESPLVKNCSALIFARNATNISLSGRGIIDGRGREPKKNQKGQDGRDRPRVKNILFASCRDISVSDLQLKNSNHWNQHYLNCEDVTVTGIRVFNHSQGNNDGIDIDGCRRFVLADSIIDSDDDGIVLKSTGGAACEDVVVTNCIVSSYANAIKCGTESLGGFRNIAISNCVIKPSRNTGVKALKMTPEGITGLSLEIVDGGTMDGVAITNLVIQGTECPLYVRLGNRGKKLHESSPVPSVGKMRNILISNIIAYSTGNYSASITGVPGGRIENISLSNIRFFNKGGLDPTDAFDATPDAHKTASAATGAPAGKFLASVSQVVEDVKGYPQPTCWKNLPCYGLFIRHVEEIDLNNVTFNHEEPEPRMPLIAVDVGSLRMTNLQFPRNDPKATILLKAVRTHEVDSDLPLEFEE